MVRNIRRVRLDMTIIEGSRDDRVGAILELHGLRWVWLWQELPGSRNGESGTRIDMVQDRSLHKILETSYMLMVWRLLKVSNKFSKTLAKEGADIPPGHLGDDIHHGQENTTNDFIPR